MRQPLTTANVTRTPARFESLVRLGLGFSYFWCIFS